MPQIDPRMEHLARQTANHRCAWCGRLPLEGHAAYCDVATGRVCYRDLAQKARPAPAPAQGGAIPNLDAFIARARSKSLEKGDYWDKAAGFLATLRGKSLDSLTHRQRQWFMGLKQDLQV